MTTDAEETNMSAVSDGVLVDAYGERDGVQWQVWCDWCVMWHWYGADEGDRAAHCMPATESPYRFMAYALRYVGPVTDEVLRAHADDERRAVRARLVWDKLRGSGQAVAWRDVYEGRIGTVKSPSRTRRRTPTEELARGATLAEAIRRANE